VLAYFDRPGTSNGPTEAINGRLEHLRGSALGFRNLTNYIARSSWRQADSDPDSYTPDCEEPRRPARLPVRRLVVVHARSRVAAMASSELVRGRQRQNSVSCSASALPWL
jgi:Transposase